MTLPARLPLPLGTARDLASNVRAVAAARWFLRSADAERRVRVWGRPAIHNWGTMVIGERCQLVSTVATLELVAFEGGTLVVGERTLLNFGTSITAAGAVSIGRRCLIGTHVTIMDHSFHRVEPDRRLEKPDPEPVTIGDDVWLGTRVIVLGGITIGAGSAVGAGSVVTKDIPPMSLAVGNPARVIRHLA